MLTKAHAIDLAAAKKGVANLEDAYKEKVETTLDPSALGQSLLEKMPSPTGWRLLILPYKGKGQTEGGIYLPDKVVEEQSVSTQVGYVLKVGELAYQDGDKFPDGPWCAKGDKLARLNSVSDIVASGLVWVPATRWAEEVVEEIAGFPFMSHDDLVDSTVMALMRFRQGGFIRLPTDEPEEQRYFKSRRGGFY